MDGSFQSSLVGTLEILAQTRRYAGVFDGTLGQFANRKSTHTGAGGAGGRGAVNAWRIAFGSQSAVFKKIPKGGAHTAKQLRAQVDYLFSKSTSVFGNMVDRDLESDVFAPADRASMVDQWSSGWRHAPARGQTSHLLVSFPADVAPEKALKIAKAWAYEMFQSRLHADDEWAYMAALHTDRPHPHIHVVLNNRGIDNNTWFYMAQDHVFEANAMRERLVEISEEFGVYLDSASRLDRGIVSYGMSRAEREIANREGRAPLERKRHGAALEAAMDQVSDTQKTVQLFADMAAFVGDDQVRKTMQSTVRALAAGDPIQPMEGKAMADQITSPPLDLDSYFAGWVQKAEAGLTDIELANRDERRVEFERITAGVTEALASEAGLVSENSVPVSALYTTQIGSDRIVSMDRKATHEVPINSETSRKLMARLKFLAGEVGIEATDVSERLRRGATSAREERQWMAQDLQAVADCNGFALDTPDHNSAARELIEDFYAKAAAIIDQAREHGLGSDDARMLTVLRRLASIAEEHGEVPFASSRDVEGFVEDLEARYGADIAERLAAGDTSALADDFTNPEEVFEVAIGILTVAKDHAFGGINRGQAIEAIVELKMQLNQDETWEQGFDDGFEL